MYAWVRKRNDKSRLVIVSGDAYQSSSLSYRARNRIQGPGKESHAQRSMYFAGGEY